MLGNPDLRQPRFVSPRCIHPSQPSPRTRNFPKGRYVHVFIIAQLLAFAGRAVDVKLQVASDLVTQSRPIIAEGPWLWYYLMIVIWNDGSLPCVNKVATRAAFQNQPHRCRHFRCPDVQISARASLQPAVFMSHSHFDTVETAA